MSIERAEELAAEIDERLAELVQIIRDAPRGDGGRRHWVFTHACGCAFGVQDAAPGESRPDAWASFYEGRPGEAFAAMERGVKLWLREDDYYRERHMPQMRPEYRCPHGGTS